MTDILDPKSIAYTMQQRESYRYNPSAMLRVSLQYLRDLTDGKVDIVDATNPFVFALENSAVNTAAFLVENKANNRKQYASVAQTQEDVYLHMSDKDYIGRFATPAMTRFGMLLNMNELLHRMVIDPDTGIGKVTIPRNTEFVVADTVFSLQYPIDIQQLTHGGLRETYDTSQLSPLQQLTTNVVDREIRYLGVDRQEFLYLEFDVTQFQIVSYNGDLNSATGYKRRLSFTEQFYYARVWHKSDVTNNEWVEMITTHTDQVYDPTQPTAVLKVLPGQLEVYVPQIYFTTDQVSGSIRVDIYQTRGDISMSMAGYKPSAFRANFRTLDPKDATASVAALIAMQNVFAFSSATVSGGANEMPFEQLRRNTILNAHGPINSPVTNVQLVSSLERQGFQVVANVDVVTNRTFLATRALPAPKDEKLITAGAASIETLITSTSTALTHPGARNNGSRVTLTPEILYVLDNGIVSMVPSNELQALLALPKDQLAATVTNGSYMYTPFHYVLDTSTSNFDVRPYYLNGPEAVTSLYVDQSDSTQLQVNTLNYAIVKQGGVYRLRVTTQSNDAYKALDDSQVFVQLSFIPVGEENRVFLSGQLVDVSDTGERTFEFAIATNFDIDADDNLWLTSFQMFSNTPRSYGCPLLKDFDIVYSTDADMDVHWNTHDIDTLLGRFLLPNQIAAITQEKIRVRFGKALGNLWASSRSIPASAPFRTYDADIPAYYLDDIYERDDRGNIFTVENGQLVFNLLHRKGEPILDLDGNPVYTHRAGDIIVGAGGLPVPISEDIVQRQLDILFIEGAYFFATDSSSATYRDTMVNTMVDWITINLATQKKTLLEQSNIFYYPKTTMGSIPVMVDSGVRTTIDAGQYFRVRLFVADTVLKDTKLREALTTATIRTLDAQLTAGTVSHSGMVSALRTAYGEDVKSFALEGLGGAADIKMLSVINESDRCSIRSRLAALPDGKLIVQEDVTVDFALHEKSA